MPGRRRPFGSCCGERHLRAGADVIDIGLAGTEEVYAAVSEFGTCAGIEVTVSTTP